MQRFFNRKVGATASAVAVVLLGVLAVPTMASRRRPNTFWVNNTVSPVAGNGTGCSQPGFASVQAAVTAAEAHASPRCSSAPAPTPSRSR